MQIFIYSKVTLHVSGVTAPIIAGHVGGKQLYQYHGLYRRLRLQFLLLLIMGAVTPETCRVTLE